MHIYCDKLYPMIFNTYLTLFRALNDHSVKYVVIGGIALNLHGIVRATEDIDLFIKPEKDNIDRLKKALSSLWEDDEIDEIRYEDFAGDYPTVRYGPPGEMFVIDFISRLGSAFSFEDIETERRELEGIQVPLATPGSLYRMKKDTVREVDRADAEALKRVFDMEEE